MHQKMQSAGLLTLIRANQQPLHILGQILLPDNLNGLAVHFNFVIIKDLIHQMILGQDFLIHTQAVINYRNPSVTFFDDLVKVVTVGLRSSGKPNGAVLRLSSPICIAPRSVVLAPVRIPVRYRGHPSIIQPLSVDPNQQFLVGNILVHTKACMSIVNILNPNNSEIKLPDNFPIALIQAADCASLPSETATTPPSPVITTPTPDAETRLANLRDLGITLEAPRLTPEQSDCLADLLIYTNRDMFATELSQLPGTNLVEHHIQTFGPPCRVRQFRHSPMVRQEIERQTQAMLKQGFILESSSPW